MYSFLNLGERGWLLQSACGWIYEEVKVSVCHWPGPPNELVYASYISQRCGCLLLSLELAGGVI